MIRNTEETTVEVPPEELWDRFLRPEKLQKIVPSVDDVTKFQSGIYKADMVLPKFNFSMPVKFQTTKRERPNRLHLESSYPEFNLHTALFQQNGQTRIEIMAELDPPPAVSLVEGRIESELKDRMEEQMDDLVAEVEGDDE